MTPPISPSLSDDKSHTNPRQLFTRARHSSVGGPAPHVIGIWRTIGGALLVRSGRCPPLRLCAHAGSPSETRWRQSGRSGSSLASVDISIRGSVRPTVQPPVSQQGRRGPCGSYGTFPEIAHCCSGAPPLPPRLDQRRSPCWEREGGVHGIQSCDFTPSARCRKKSDRESPQQPGCCTSSTRTSPSIPPSWSH